MARDGLLLIGGGGFLGLALARRLAREKRHVEILARGEVPAAPPGVPVHQGGMENATALRGALERCGTVFHLASRTTPGSSAVDPQLEVEANLRPTLAALEVLREFPATGLVYLSTGGALYGDVQGRPAREDDPVAPRSHHGATKAQIEAALAGWAPLAVLRPSNLYGPGQGLRAGFGIVRTMLEHARSGAPMQIWGDGSTVRDFLYIDDMVEACWRVLQVQGTFNVGSGVGCSLAALRGLVERVTGKRVAVAHVPARAADVRHIVLDAGRLRAAAGWAPKMEMEEGLRRTWRWLEDGAAP